MSAINQFKIVSLGVALDTYDDIDISLTYQIDDIEDITVKKSSFSKTIILPGTQTNNQYFKNIFDVNIDISETTYNPKKALPVQVLIGDELVFQGNLQLLNIITNQKQVDYEVVITGIFKNIIIGFGDYFLNQLNLDEYDHFRSTQTIIDSWDNKISIDNPLTTVLSQPGIGYTYPVLPNGQNSIIAPNGLKKFNSFDLNPAVYIRTLIDKMFEFAGYTYTSNFFESLYFNSLVMPTETPQYTTEDILDKTVRVTYQDDFPFFMSPKLNNGLQSYYSPQSTLSGYSALSPLLEKSSSWWSNTTNGSWYVPFPTESGTYGGQVMQDPNNEWIYQNNGVTRYTCQTAGFYSIDLDNSFYVFYKHEMGSSFKYLSGSIKYLAQLVKIGINGVSTVLTQTSVLSIVPPTAGVTGIFAGSVYTVPSTGYMPSGFLASTSPYISNLTVPSVWLNAGEQIRINFQVLYDGNVQWQSNVNKILVGMVSKRTVSGSINRLEIKPSVTTNYGVNSVIKLSKMLPQMKMRDLFINIIKMFNLMVTDNPDVDNDLIIEPRDAFFNSKQKVNDWTYKLDYDQDVKQTPMSELDTKTYKFTYDSDDDYYNNLYEQQTGRVYGDLTVDFLNDFSVESKQLKLEFAPTPVSDNIISPLIAPFFCDIDTNNALEPIKVKPRILFAKKKALTNQFYVITDNPNQAGQTLSTYMYTGMYDDPLDPEYSLEFGNSNVLYYSTSVCCPYNTLVNQFYLSTLNDITDVNAKLLEAYFHLTPSDMNKFDFRDIILIDNSYWRVNRIVDYNPNAIDRTTKVILYKLNFLDIFYNNNKELALTQNTCPSDVVLKKSKYGYIYVSLSNAPITQDCCNLWGGIWNNGYCVSTQPVINKPGGGLPYADPKKKLFVSDNQITTGSIFLERPFQLLKNLNIINSDTVLVKGENNYVDQGASNSMILGNNNSIPFGVKNALVIGDNITNPKENSIVVGDIMISSNGIEYYNVYKIDGGFETVMNEGKTNLIDIIDGTFESVRNYGGDSKLRVIISGANAQTETDFEDR